MYIIPFTKERRLRKATSDLAFYISQGCNIVNSLNESSKDHHLKYNEVAERWITITEQMTLSDLVEINKNQKEQLGLFKLSCIYGNYKRSLRKLM